MIRSLLPALIALAACINASASDTSRNPDRWITSDLSLVGTSSFKGDQVSYRPGPDIDQQQRNLNLAGGALGIFPISNSITLLASFGGNWTEALIEGNSAFGGTTSDNTLATYMAGARYYFLDHHLLSSDPNQNPDRWPSIGLTLNAETSLAYNASNATFQLPNNLHTQNETLTIDTRLPLADALSLTESVGVNRMYSRSDPQVSPLGPPNIDGIKTEQSNFIASTGIRYFFVGQNLILKDHEQNPDRWTMLSLTVSGQGAFYARTTIRTLAGVEGMRGKNTRLYSATSELRVPITDHMSLHFDLTGNYNRLSEPEMFGPAHNGYLSRLSTMGFGAGLRYFFF